MNRSMPASPQSATNFAASLYKYSATVAPYIDACATPDDGERPEIPFLRARVPAGASVLDIGAGAGGLALQLASNGYRVTALEPDAGMYGVMLTRIASLPGRQSNLTPVPRAIGFELGETFDLCLTLAVLHHLDGEGRAALFWYAATHLQTGGLFVLDAPVQSTARVEVPHQLRSERIYGTTRFQHWHSARPVGDGRWQTMWEFVTLRAGEVIDRRSQVFDWSMSSREEVAALASAAGLQTEETLAGFDGAPYVNGDSRSIVSVMRKPR